MVLCGGFVYALSKADLRTTMYGSFADLALAMLARRSETTLYVTAKTAVPSSKETRATILSRRMRVVELPRRVDRVFMHLLPDSLLPALDVSLLGRNATDIALLSAPLAYLSRGANSQRRPFRNTHAYVNHRGCVYEQPASDWC